MCVSAQVSTLCHPVGVMTTEIKLTHVEESIKHILPWAHGYQTRHFNSRWTARAIYILARLFAKHAQGADEALRTGPSLSSVRGAFSAY
jgi:hypothetical protein